ncbi:MAG: GNAT family protein, partial [Gemmatimonadota bacterium]
VPWGPNTEQVTRDFLARNIERAAEEPRDDFSLAIVPKGEDRLVGTAGIYVKGHQAMLGYALHRRAWGLGYATEASLAMIEMAFDVLGLRRVWAACDAENTASARVLQKCGMVLEGHLRHDTEIRGELRDTLVWGLLVAEWNRTSNEDNE